MTAYCQNKVLLKPEWQCSKNSEALSAERTLLLNAHYAFQNSCTLKCLLKVNALLIRHTHACILSPNTVIPFAHDLPHQLCNNDQNGLVNLTSLVPYRTVWFSACNHASSTPIMLIMQVTTTQGNMWTSVS